VDCSRPELINQLKESYLLRQYFCNHRSLIVCNLSAFFFKDEMTIFHLFAYFALMIKFIRHLIVYSCLLLPFFATAQTDVELQLKTHVTYLADDKLEGRATGSIGEQLASKYIQSEFEQLRLQPLGDDGSYFQQFSFRAGKQAGDSNFLITDNRKYSYPQIIPSI
jgi:hypothetical protein